LRGALDITTAIGQFATPVASLSEIDNSMNLGGRFVYINGGSRGLFGLAVEFVSGGEEV
jgi:N-acetylmuramic acid 6-phosphate (MurNAc-6-P) etherase